MITVCLAKVDDLSLCLCVQNGTTALHMAAQEGNVGVVGLLTEAKAQINMQAKVRTSTVTTDLLLWTHRLHKMPKCILNVAGIL